MQKWENYIKPHKVTTIYKYKNKSLQDNRSNSTVVAYNNVETIGLGGDYIQTFSEDYLCMLAN